MIKKVPAIIIIIAGSVIAVLFAISFMNGDSDPIHILAMEIGIVIIMGGIGFAIFQSEREQSSRSPWLLLRDKLYELPIFFWVALGFLINCFLFFIIPTFLNPNLRIQYPQNYIHDSSPIGTDLLRNLRSINAVFVENKFRDILNPPIVNFLFAPLLIVAYPIAYILITLVTFVSYIFSIVFAVLISKRERYTTLLLVAALSIFSYGLQAEFERGQFYTIAMMLSLAAIYIFHKRPRYRFFAYVLFTISVQLKIVPALLVFMFVDDWRDWKNNLKRFIALGLVNFLALFLQGVAYFNAFFHALKLQSDLGQIRTANHSLLAFVGMLRNSGIGNLDFIPAALYVCVLICLGVVLVEAYLRNEKGLDVNLLLALTLGMLILPSTSHDYALPMLTVPFALAIASQSIENLPWKGLTVILLVFLGSLAYSATLFSYAYRPAYLNNSFPLLLIILVVVALLSLLKGRQPEALQ